MKMKKMKGYTSSVTAEPCHLSRCDSVTFGENNTQLFSYTLRPLRYPRRGRLTGAASRSPTMIMQRLPSICLSMQYLRGACNTAYNRKSSIAWETIFNFHLSIFNLICIDFSDKQCYNIYWFNVCIYGRAGALCEKIFS